MESDMNFSSLDTSTSQQKSKDYSDKAPFYRTVGPGLNIEAICEKYDC
jgi:hypothetical protein